MSGVTKKLGQAHAARLERIIKRKRAGAAAPGEAARQTPAVLTSAQKTASEPRLRGACVAQPQHF